MSDDLRSRAESRARDTAAESQEAVRLSSEESRRTEVDLETSRARYFDLYDLAPVGYLTINDGGLVVEANLTASTLLGVVRGALVKQPMTRFLVAEDQDSYYLFRKRLFATGAPQVLELRLRKHDGTQFWARFEATTAQGADAGTEVCRLVVSDITDRKRIEAERLRFEQELRQAQKAESLARMAGAIAHHFNNQLAVVMSNQGHHSADPVRSDHAAHGWLGDGGGPAQAVARHSHRLNQRVRRGRRHGRRPCRTALGKG